MELLGSYSSQLTSSYYQELLALLDSAISSGDLGGGSSFNQSNVLSLEQQAQSFAALPTGTAGSRVTDDSFNYPLSLLLARLNSLQSEVNSFTTVSGRLLDVLQNETDLVDDLLAADSLAHWIASLPQIRGAWTTSWDFSIGQGPKSATLIPFDPSNQVIAYNENTIGAVLDCTGVSPAFTAGIRPPVTPRKFPFKSMSWTFPSTGIPQELYGPDLSWTQLDLLETLPSIDFSAPPSVQPILPEGSNVTSVFQFVGQVPGGALPTYVRVLFHPRLNSRSAVATQTVSDVYDVIPLSPYSIDPNSVVVLSEDGSKAYTLTTDFNTDALGTMTPVDIPVNENLSIYFTEYWPAYQCSTDQTTWSQLVMLDVNRPYPDDTTDFLPIGIENGLFPLMDETGVSTGIYFKPLQVLVTTYTLLVTTPAGSVSGPEVWLELDVSQPGFLNAVQISPYAAFPAILEQVDVEGLTATTRNSAFIGSFLLDRPLSILFDRQIVSKIYLKFMQQNYTIKEYQDESEDALRRNTMNSLQASLPFAVRGSTPAVPTVLRGYQYELGFEDLTALDIQPIPFGVFVQGPIVIPGCPDVIRLDMQTGGFASALIAYRAFDINGALLDENIPGIFMNSGDARVFPFTSGVVRANVNTTEIDVRFLLTEADAVVQRYYIQATLH